MSKLLSVALASLALAGPALAQTGTTPAGPSLEIVDAAARLRVIPEDRADIAVSVTPSARIAAPAVRRQGDRVVIDGGFRNRIRGCTEWLSNRRAAQINGIGAVRVEDLPLIEVRTPRALNLTAGGAVYSEIGASAGGVAVFRGCGDARLGRSSGDLELTLYGSGDVTANAVDGVLIARLEGSGDLTAHSARGAHATLDGSGDLDIGAVAGPLTARLHGSGDLEIAHVEGGDLDLRLDGSGDLRVAAGSAARLEADLRGSGDLTFGGRAAVVAATLNGSGDLTIAHADRVERQAERGSGDLSIGR